MSISATEALTQANAFSSATPSTTGAQEDKQMFMELMVAQLRYQDPLNPTDSGEFLAQSAQFTALEKMTAVADGIGALLGTQMAFGAGAMVGKPVSWIDADGETTHTGTIDSVSFGPEGPTFSVGGVEVGIGQLLSVTSGAPPSTDTSTSTSTGTSTGDSAETTDPTDPVGTAGTAA